MPIYKIYEMDRLLRYPSRVRFTYEYRAIDRESAIRDYIENNFSRSVVASTIDRNGNFTIAIDDNGPIDCAIREMCSK